MPRQEEQPLQWYQEDFLASLSPQPGSNEARTMTVTSGQKCSELYRKSGPLGSLVRTLLESSAWRSTQCFLTWKESATPSRRLLFRLVPSTPRTGETGLRLWATPNTMDYLPQRSAESLKRQAETSRKGRTRPANLREQVCEETVRMWPTPTAMDSKGLDNHLRKDASNSRSILLSQKVTLIEHGEGGQDLATSVGGLLNPTWVEWLMGFPIGWTDLSASEMP